MIFNILERHRDKWVEDGECYRWIGATTGGKWPTAQLTIRMKKALVPRLVCEEINGPQPPDKPLVLHDTPNGCIGSLCVNGEHLRWGTHTENMQDIPPEVRSEKIRRGHRARYVKWWKYRKPDSRR